MIDEESVIKNWLKIALEKRTEEVAEQCEESTEECYSKLVNLLQEIKKSNPDLATVTDQIENLFITKTRIDTEYIYPLVISEGIEIGKNLR